MASIKRNFLTALKALAGEYQITMKEEAVESQEPDRESFRVLFTTEPQKIGRSRQRDQYENTYNFQVLVAKYSLSEYAVWEIYGEDPNCDMGGSHHMPVLGQVEGRLDDVINYGVKLSGFWQWGGGGDFRKITPKKIKKV